jgi:protein TonB
VAIAPAPAPEAPPAPPAPPAPVRAARPAIGNVQSCAPKADDYPPAAIRAEATGTTKIRFTVDAQGKLAKAEVVRSAGSSREHRALDRVAEQKLSECKFTPGIDENGRPTGGTFEVDYVWKLN